MIKNLILIFAVLSFGSFSAQKKYEHVALINGVAHLGNGEVIDGAIVAFNKDRIEMVAETKGIKLNPRVYDTVFDINGMHIYPAIINTNNILGLHDAEAVRATRDFAEVGHLNPHIRALIAYNTDNVIVPTIKTNGVLYTQCTPRGGLISGASSIMALEGWNWEDAVLKADDGIHLNFPRMADKKPEAEAESAAAKKYQEELYQLNKFFSDAKIYCNKTDNLEKNIRFEAMRPVLSGSANLYFHADRAKDILTAINFANKHNIKKPVIVGGKDAYKITKELKKQQIPVMLNRIHDLPDRNDENVDISFSIPQMLTKDSILFCLQLEGDMEAAQSRNLPFNAGTTVAYGLSKEQALQSITLNAAKILGLEKELGSLEVGKLASIVVSDGDILDMKTNNVTLAWIAGKPVTLYNKQTELYLRYKAKYGIK
jgi:hypothetical protein